MWRCFVMRGSTVMPQTGPIKLRLYCFRAMLGSEAAGSPAPNTSYRADLRFDLWDPGVGAERVMRPTSAHEAVPGRQAASAMAS